MVENKFQILRLETSPCSGRHRESMKITGKMDWNCCNWMSISDYYLRKWPAPDCPLNPLQRVALHTRHAGRVLPRLAQDSVTRRGLRIEDDHSRWAASTTAHSVFRQKGTGFAGLDRGLVPFPATAPALDPLRLRQQLPAPLECTGAAGAPLASLAPTTICNWFAASGWFLPPLSSGNLFTDCYQIAWFNESSFWSV